MMKDFEKEEVVNVIKYGRGSLQDSSKENGNSRKTSGFIVIIVEFDELVEIGPVVAIVAFTGIIVSEIIVTKVTDKSRPRPEWAELIKIEFVGFHHFCFSFRLFTSITVFSPKSGSSEIIIEKMSLFPIHIKCRCAQINIDIRQCVQIIIKLITVTIIMRQFLTFLIELIVPGQTR
ncbi:hypothetical protein BLNAU_21358 [Blattamonas nauphoetae]|uniref:Uncharacterized protein n=1 Tax=Blattamonas nauphoetae TaxID=2049346 RepID=A0ABQ9WYC8_9EUKA|nr:hypothetical protein BLNAU_21358 [Blattamonas nauphoetae]